MEAVKRFVRDERGLETVEYAVIMALIIAGTVVAIGLLRDAVRARFVETRDVVESASATTPTL